MATKEEAQGWFKVIHKNRGTRYFAKVTKVSHDTDYGYSKWETPVEYTVVYPDQKGYVEVPMSGVVGVKYTHVEFWQDYRRDE
jgi:hypothetical protein